MREIDLMYDRKYTPSADVIEKLIQSHKDAEKYEKKIYKCPICGARGLEFYSNEKPILDVKCWKCKYEGPINLAYFRRRRKQFFFKKIIKTR